MPTSTKRKYDDITIDKPLGGNKCSFSDLMLSSIVMNMTDDYVLDDEFKKNISLRYRSTPNFANQLKLFLLNIKKNGFPLPANVHKPVRHRYKLNEKFIEDVIDITSKAQPGFGFKDSTNQVPIRSPYVILSRGADPSYCPTERIRLVELFERYQIFEKVYVQVRAYMSKKSLIIQDEFNKIYSDENCRPNQCFVNYYEPGNNDVGVGTHRDRAPFVTVVISLTEDKMDGLFVEVRQEAVQYRFKVGGSLIFDRLFHGVAYCQRKSCRCTINMFY